MALIGIDLGTKKACVEIFHENKIELITNARGNRTTPSIVAFTDNGILIGEAAKEQKNQNIPNTIYDIILFLGRKISDPEIQKLINKYPFKIIPDELGKIKFEIELERKTRQFYPEEIVAMLLKKLIIDAEIYLNKKVEKVFISIPAFFNSNQRQAIMDAAKLIDLDVFRLMSDTLAAAFTYFFTKENRRKELLLVVDIGGGTTDISLIKFENWIIEMISSSGRINFGGNTFDDQLLNYTLKFLNDTYPQLNIYQSPQKIQLIRDLCENAKIKLSTETTTEINYNDPLFEGNEIKVNISRSLFENLNENQFNSIINNINELFRTGEVKKDEVTDIVFVGCSSQIPCIQKMVENYFNDKIHSSIPVCFEEFSAIGAAIYATLLRYVDNDKLKDCLIIDGFPIPTRIETTNQIIIPPNYAIPHVYSQIYTTIPADQNEIKIRVFQGFHEQLLDNTLIETTTITDLPPEGLSIPGINVSVKIDANGIVEVYAFNQMHGVHRIIVKHENNSLSNKDIEIMKDRLESMHYL